MRTRKCIVASILLALAPLASANSIDDTVGLEASIDAFSQAFASPPLPSLDNNGRVVTPMIGWVTVKTAPITTSDGSETPQYNGQVQGELGSVTYNQSGQGDFGYFFTVAVGHVSGDMSVSLSGATDTIDNIAATTYLASAGFSYRAIGNAKSLFALGLFGGPAYMLTSTSATITPANSTASQGSMNPSMYGAYFGLQLLFRFGILRINPYMNAFSDLSQHCRSADFEGSTNSNQLVTLCQNGQPGIEIDGSVFGAGVNLGLGPVRFNAVSMSTGKQEYLKASAYSISYGFSF